jgi:nucleotide-binding universal stress UspA family protein
MTYASILVTLSLGRTNAQRLGVVGDLAERFEAHIIGMAVCQPIHISSSDAYLLSDLAVQDRESRMQEMAAAETEFRNAMRGRAKSFDWRAYLTVAPLADEVATRARSADLVVSGGDRHQNQFEISNPLRAGDLVMQTGRPVLIVPDGVERFSLDHVMVAWKDGREARRAISDGLPLLKKAGRVTVMEVAPAAEAAEVRSRLADVVAWLGRHGIAATALPVESGSDEAARVNMTAAGQKADLVVAGAYAHSRIHEWVLGGVTRDLLLHTDRCAMVSH